MSPQTRTALTHVGTAAGGALATAMWMASDGTNLYALINQFNVVVAEIGKFVALLVPFATAAYGVYKASTRAKLTDLAADPAFKGAIVSPQLAMEVPSNKVVASVTALPSAAKTA